MSFIIKWPEFSNDFIEKAKEQLTIALNKGQKPANIVDRIVVTSLNMGTVPPDLELLEIGEFSDTKFRGILKLQYNGNGFLVLQTKVQANPLTSTQHALLINPHQGYLAAHQPLVVPMQLKISQLNIRGIFVLVVDKFRGITVSFKNDPLESVQVSSTFDNVSNIRRFLQGLIEKELRQLLQETLPLLIHTMSLRYIHGRYRGSSGGSEANPSSPCNSNLPPSTSEREAVQGQRSKEGLTQSRPYKWLGNEDAGGSKYAQFPFGSSSAGSPWERSLDIDGDPFLSSPVYVHRHALGIRTESPLHSHSSSSGNGGSGSLRRPAVGGLHQLFDPEPVIPQTILRHQLLHGKGDNRVTQSDIFDREMEKSRMISFQHGSAGNLQQIDKPPASARYSSGMPSLHGSTSGGALPRIGTSQLRHSLGDSVSESGRMGDVPRHRSRLVLSHRESPKVGTRLQNLVNAHRTISPYVQGWEGDHFVFRSSPLRKPTTLNSEVFHSPETGPNSNPLEEELKIKRRPFDVTQRPNSYASAAKSGSEFTLSAVNCRRTIGSALPVVPSGKQRKIKTFSASLQRKFD